MVKIKRTPRVNVTSVDNLVRSKNKESENSHTELPLVKNIETKNKDEQIKRQNLDSKVGIQTCKREKFPCPLCPKEFKNKSGRYNHIKIHHKVKLEFGKVQCLETDCLFSCTYTTVLQQHLTDVHNIPMKYLNLEFDNYEDFEKWKHNFETGEVCRFVQKSGSRVGETGKSMYLYCSRSGTFVSHSKGRRFKKLGTAKISAHCTALIKYFEESSGKVKATVCATHYGHDKDHRFLRLTKMQKRHIAEKMRSGMSRELVLDSIRSTFVNKLDRIHELSKKDLNNIQKSYKIPKTADRRKSHPTIDLSNLIVEDWINDLQEQLESPVLYYKNIDTENGKIINKDKCLILMTKGQKDLFLKFCNNGVIYVTIIKLSISVPLHLTVIFMSDDFYEMFPVCFMISNDKRYEILKLCFDQILNVIGPINLCTLATDDEKYIYEAWCDVMGPTSNHIIANRFIDTEWRRNLTMVENEAFQGEIYDKLYDFIERTDGTKDKMESLIIDLRSSIVTSQFAAYLEKNFLENIRLWSSYYLKEQFGLGEPIDFETSYSKIASLCETCCKYNKPVSYGARGLIKLVLDFQSNRNRKVAENIVEINNAHDLSSTCGIENVFPFTNNVWKVNLSHDGKNTDLCEVRIEQCNFDDCVLMCERCEACVHNFHCVCDNYVDGRTCVHVHLVGSMLKKIRTDLNVEDADKVLIKFGEFTENLKTFEDTESNKNTETHSLKLKSLLILEDIAKILLKENDDNNINHLHSVIKEFHGNMDVLLTYGSYAKNMVFVKNSKPVKKKNTKATVIKKHTRRKSKRGSKEV